MKKMRSLLLLSMTALFLFLSVGNGYSQDTVTGAFQGDVSNNLTGDPVAGVV